MRLVAFLILLGFASLAGARGPAGEPYHLIPGQFGPSSNPDGNAILLDAPEGLILVDTGRHPAFTERLIAYARERGRPIAAIVNTHWHLDHTSGNGLVRAAYPQAQVYASNAVDGALQTFLRENREERRAPARRRADPRGAARRSAAVPGDHGS